MRDQALNGQWENREEESTHRQRWGKPDSMPPDVRMQGWSSFQLGSETSSKELYKISVDTLRYEPVWQRAENSHLKLPCFCWSQQSIYPILKSCATVNLSSSLQRPLEAGPVALAPLD